MIEIKTCKIADCRITVPGSKSYTHRMLIAAALSDGVCIIQNPLVSEDTRFTMGALKQLGIRIENDACDLRIYGKSGVLKPVANPIYLGDSGTSLRLLCGVAALGKGTYTLTGDTRMQIRPIKDLLTALNQMGVETRSVKNNGCPPIEISGTPIITDRVDVNCRKSSQYLSALLLISPMIQNGLEIHVIDGPVSRPYVDLTLGVMDTFDVQFERDGYQQFIVPKGQHYRSGKYGVEPDCSHAAYFWAAAAITGAEIKVMGTAVDSFQGDVGFVDILKKMGCRVSCDSDGIGVAGGPLHAVEVDMADLPDQVPTLAVVAAFAKGTTRITNVAHLKSKESDRLCATAVELNKMGIQAECSDNALMVKGGAPTGSIVDTYHDHRIAMSFAVSGLKVPGIQIRDPNCVEKSFPNFWEVFNGLYQR